MNIGRQKRGNYCAVQKIPTERGKGIAEVTVVLHYGVKKKQNELKLKSGYCYKKVEKFNNVLGARQGRILKVQVTTYGLIHLTGRLPPHKTIYHF